MGHLRILIADDHEIVRRGLTSLLSSRPGWVVCAEASTGRDAVALAEQHRPDIVVMDISMPGLNGLEATRKIRKMLPKTQVVILSIHYSDQLVREVVDSGARAYVLKSDASRRPFNCRRSPCQSSIILHVGCCSNPDRWILQPSLGTATHLMRKALSAREREIVQLVAEGKSSKEVAVALGISVKTAETHRSNIMRKLEMHSVSELVRYAVRNNMIEP